MAKRKETFGKVEAGKRLAKLTDKPKRIKTYDVSEWRCPICNSGQILHRANSDDHRCRKCGNVFRLNFIKVKKSKPLIK